LYLFFIFRNFKNSLEIKVTVTGGLSFQMKFDV